MRDDGWIPASTPAAVIDERMAALEAAIEVEPDPDELRNLHLMLRTAKHARYRADFVRRDENGAIYYSPEYDHTYREVPEDAF